MLILSHPLRRITILLAFTVSAAGLTATSLSGTLLAQAPTPARATPQRGTVKAVEGDHLTLTTDSGQELVVAVPEAARIQRLAPGSTDLKTAEAATLSDIAVGDRVLTTGAPGETPSTFTASRVILMKSGDIAQKHEAEQQDWQRHGAGGIVDSVDGSGVITVSSGARKLAVTTTAATKFRRYADGSVKFEDAKPGTLSQIHAGDQVLARGAKSDDGSSVQAEEVVSGSFKNLSGTVVSIDATNSTVSLKDLATKRNVTVQLTGNSAIHRLPPEAAARLAARSGAGGGAAGGAARTASSGGQAHTASGSAPGETAGPGARPGGTGHGGGDLSQVVARLPQVAASDLHAGDAVMIVAEQSSGQAGSLTAITLLAGVEPILASSSSGSSAMTLSPWSVGTGSPDAGGTQ